ncbi:MAG TPA: class I SAM-dependent methyltransferase [Longimicrobiales bacterium]|nr:class I SAM-dependent methyltransferase [Longimicrobiales bacterium]
MRQDHVAGHDDLEEQYWWFVARRRIIGDLVRRRLAQRGSPVARPRLLEIGCATVGMLKEFASLGDVVGIDASEFMVARARAKTGVDVRLGRLPDDLPVESGSWDVIALLDVLEHIERDEAALQVVRRLLRPGGMLILTVPALQFLWTGHDVVNEHWRRYDRDGLQRLLRRAGLEVEKLSYFNSFLFPPIAAVRLWNRLRPRPPRPDMRREAPWLNRVLTAAFSAERYWLRWGRFPVGVSLLAVATASGPEDNLGSVPQ